MPTRNSNQWMWSQACDLLDQAERRHRQFFRLTVSGQARMVWEPPVDLFEDEQGVVVIVALPGVPIERIEISYESGVLTIRAQRPIAFAGSAGSLRRIEIPYGFFERHIHLPETSLESATSELLNGCLTIKLRKSGAS